LGNVTGLWIERRAVTPFTPYKKWATTASHTFFVLARVFNLKPQHIAQSPRGFSGTRKPEPETQAIKKSS
jgi:hypothetical protein